MSEQATKPLFPVASTVERSRAKAMLKDYHRMDQYRVDFERQGLDRLPPEQYKQYESYKQTTDDLRRAVDLILDEEERNIISFRYIKGNRHKVTVLRFRAIMDMRTVDRRLLSGVESVANTLKLWGKI